MVRTTIGGLAVAVGLSAFAAPAVAAPGNDDFEHAAALGGGARVSVNGTLAGAGSQPGDPLGRAADVWYSYTPAAGGPVAISLPERDGSVAPPPTVYTGADRGHLLPVPSTQDGWYGRSRIDAVAGQTYWILVSGWQPQGDFTLRVRPAAAPSDDDFADARAVRVPGLYHGSLEEATAELGEPAIGRSQQASAWVRIRPRNSSRLTVDARGSSCGATVGAFTGSDVDDLHRVAEHFTTIRFAAVRNHTYMLRVSCPGGYLGDYTLDVSDGSIKGKGVHMAVKPGQTIHSVRAHGLRLDVGARRKVGVSIDLLVSRSTARTLHLRERVLGHVRGQLGYGQKAPATIRLNAAARRALAGRRSVKATARLTLLDNAPDRVLEVPVRLQATMGA
jgi:hypothetical protein